MQNDPKDLPKFLEALKNFDCVCGTRVKARGEGDNFIRVASSRIANWVRNKLSGEQISDAGCTYRAFKRECIENLKFFKGMHRFLPTLFKIEGHTVTEIEVSNNPRFAGQSNYGVWNRLFASFYDLLAVRWMKKRMFKYKIAEKSISVSDGCPRGAKLGTRGRAARAPQNMQRFLIKCVNCALLIIIVIGVPAVTRAQFWNVQIVSAPKLQLLSFWGLSLALGGNILAAAFLFKGRKERMLCWEWAAVFGALLFAYCAFVLGYFKFDWLKNILLWVQSHSSNRTEQIAPQAE